MGSADSAVKLAQTVRVKLTGARVPALDGLRGIAVLLVVFAHVGVPGFRWGGQVGVTLFFVLSGYLISGILLRGPSMGDFYLRRAARLLPALAVVVAAGVALGMAPREWVPVVAYVGNWWRIVGGNLAELNHAWSLAVEEQFYLLWPLVLPFLVKRNRLLWAIAAVLAWRSMAPLLGLGLEVQMGTVSNSLGLLVGALLAARRWEVPARWWWPAVGVLVLACAVPVWDFQWGLAVVTPLAVAAAAVGVGARSFAEPPRWMVWLGHRSYGWYLWHQFLITSPLFGTPDQLGRNVVLALVALGFAEVSLRLIEEPILTWARDQRAPRLTTVSADRRL